MASWNLRRLLKRGTAGRVQGHLSIILRLSAEISPNILMTYFLTFFTWGR
jgi:hypothetical protein